MAKIKIRYYANGPSIFEVVVTIDSSVYYYVFREKWFILDRLKKIRRKKVITFHDVNFVKKHCRLFLKKKDEKNAEKTA